MILLTTSAMALKNYGELRQLFQTFTRVWEAGGDTTLHLHTQDDKARATLDIQLGPPADPRLELQMCEGMGLDQAMAPSTTCNHISGSPNDVDLLPEPRMKYVARPGCR